VVIVAASQCASIPANMLSSLREAVIGQRLNPQAPKHPPWFEGYYIRVVSPQHSFGLVSRPP